MASVFERWGVSVHVDPHGDNLVRSLRPEERAALARPPLPDPTWMAARASALGVPPVRLGPAAPYRVEAEGMPNLAHEFAHVLLAGLVADDHGIDYTRIPLDVSQAADRQLLWDELACSWWSCGVVARARGRAAAQAAKAGAGLSSPRAIASSGLAPGLAAEAPSEVLEASGLAGAGVAGSARADAEVHPVIAAWFAEQVEIQPVFYGDADDVEGRLKFADRVDTWLARDGATMAATCAGLDRLASEHLRATLAPDDPDTPWFDPLLVSAVTEGSLGGGGASERQPFVEFSTLWRHYTAALRAT